MDIFANKIGIADQFWWIYWNIFQMLIKAVDSFQMFTQVFMFGFLANSLELLSSSNSDLSILTINGIWFHAPHKYYVTRMSFQFSAFLVVLHCNSPDIKCVSDHSSGLTWQLITKIRKMLICYSDGSGIRHPTPPHTKPMRAGQKQEILALLEVTTICTSEAWR